MDEDISKKSIAILLVLVTVLSAIGTYAVLSEISKIEAAEVRLVEETPAATAKVRLNILEPETKQVSMATGKVVLNILPQE